MDMVSMAPCSSVSPSMPRARSRTSACSTIRANEALASVSVRSIIEAEIPPIPKDIAPTLAGGQLEVDYSFSIVGR